MSQVASCLVPCRMDMVPYVGPEMRSDQGGAMMMDRLPSLGFPRR